MPKLLHVPNPGTKQKSKTQYHAPLASVRPMPDAEEEEASELAIVDKWVALADIVLGNASRKRKRA